LEYGVSDKCVIMWRKNYPLYRRTSMPTEHYLVKLWESELLQIWCYFTLLLAKKTGV